MSAQEALARTIPLARHNLTEGLADNEILGALTSVSVQLIADERNLTTAEGQHALVTAATLAARSGATCIIQAPNVDLLGVHPLLRERRLVDALLELGEDLIPGQSMQTSRGRQAVDLAIAIGDSPAAPNARQHLRLSGSAWEGRIGATGEPFPASGSPFGALASAGLAATEAYKHGMRRLRAHSTHPAFDDFFRGQSEARVLLAPSHAPAPPARLGDFDAISGGAIIQSALYVLSKIGRVRGVVRVIEPDIHALSNINRYSLLRRKSVGETKVATLAGLDLGGLQVTPVSARYGAVHRPQIGPLASHVLVGVDNVEARWDVADEHTAWIGVGATEDYLAFRTFHMPGLPCTRCLHLEGTAPNGELPSAAFVSFWAGLALAATFALRRLGAPIPQQVLQLSTLQLGAPAGTWAMPGVPDPECACTSGAAAT